MLFFFVMGDAQSFLRVQYEQALGYVSNLFLNNGSVTFYVSAFVNISHDFLAAF